MKEDKSPEFTNITIEKCIAVIGRQALEFEETIKTLEKQIESNFAYFMYILIFNLSYIFYKIDF